MSRYTLPSLPTLWGLKAFFCIHALFRRGRNSIRAAPHIRNLLKVSSELGSCASVTDIVSQLSQGLDPMAAASHRYKPSSLPLGWSGACTTSTLERRYLFLRHIYKQKDFFLHYCV